MWYTNVFRAIDCLFYAKTFYSLYPFLIQFVILHMERGIKVFRFIPRCPVLFHTIPRTGLSKSQMSRSGVQDSQQVRIEWEFSIFIRVLAQKAWAWKRPKLHMAQRDSPVMRNFFLPTIMMIEKCMESIVLMHNRARTRSRFQALDLWLCPKLNRMDCRRRTSGRQWACMSFPIPRFSYL